jgi:hypothetical protein
LASTFTWPLGINAWLLKVTGSTEQNARGAASDTDLEFETVVSCANATVGKRVAETSMAQVFFMR